MTTIRELMGRITQGVWETGADLLTVQIGGRPISLTKNGWSIRVLEAKNTAQVGIAEATANASAASVIPELLALAAAVEEYDAEMETKGGSGAGAYRTALAALQAKLEAK